MIDRNSEKRIEEKFKSLSGSSSLSLSTKEKNLHKERLLEYTEMKPVRNGEVARHIGMEENRSPLFINLFNFKNKKMPALIASLIIALTAGGGVSIAAENALPGDTLYPVKTEVNEEIRSFFAFSGEAQANWDIKRAERRFDETSGLAVRGELTEETKAKIESNLEEREEKLETKIAELEAKGEVEAATRISSKLEALAEAHERVLASLEVGSEIDSETKVNLRPILLKVRDIRSKAIQFRMNAEAGVETSGEGAEASAEARLRAATNILNEAERRFERVEGEISVESRTSAEAKIQTAANAKAEAESLIEAESYANALVKIRESITASFEADAIMRLGVFRERASQKAEENSERTREESSETEENNKNEEGSNENESNTNTEAEVEAEGEVEVEIPGVKIDASGEAKSKTELNLSL